MTETSTPAPNRNKAQIGLSAADVKSLCDAAEVAWARQILAHVAGSSLGENGVTNLD